MPKISLYISQKIIVFSLLAVHTFYLVIFCLMGEEILAVANILSVSIYLFALKILFDSEENNKIVMFILQVEILLHASLCVFILGLGWGFEILFLTSTISLFFLSVSFKMLSRLISLLDIAAFLLFYLVIDIPVKDDTLYKEIFFVFNLTASCVFAVLTSFLLESSNLFIFLGILEEKESAKAVFNHDPLTGLLNRASMQQIFRQKNLFDGNDFAIVMCDIDNFKKINDTYGHDWGDKVLKEIARALQDTFRENDHICRWGGEEFLVILPEVKTEDVKKVETRLGTRIAQVKLPDKSSVTMTFGLVLCANGVITDIDTVINKADKKLYEGKKNGKDRIEYEIMKANKDKDNA